MLPTTLPTSPSFMPAPYKVSAVSYLNTKPFLAGLKAAELLPQVDLETDIPSVCAEKLLVGLVDMALVPVAVLRKVPRAYINSTYCIGADGKVKTVCLFSDVPIEQVEKVYLDYQSRTSVRLFEILCDEYWLIAPEMLPAEPGYTKLIQGTTAGVVIGDRAIALLEKHAYVYDLAETWKQHTGLPFVFAVWASLKPLDDEFINAFDESASLGMSFRDEIAKEYSHLNNSLFTTREYLFQNLSFELSEDKQRAMRMFLDKLCEREQISAPELFFAKGR